MTLSNRGAWRLAALLCGMMSASGANADWPLNVPSTLLQWNGYGVGPGYHAPLILVRPCRSKSTKQRIIYTRHPSKANSCAGGFCAGMSAIPAAAGHYPANGIPTHPAMHTRHAAPVAAPIEGTRLFGPPPAAVEPPSPSDNKIEAAAAPESIPLPSN